MGMDSSKKIKNRNVMKIKRVVSAGRKGSGCNFIKSPGFLLTLVNISGYSEADATP